MKTLIIKDIPKKEDGIKVTDPQMSLTNIKNCYINYEEFGEKNTEIFLKNYFNDVTIYAKKKLPKNLMKLIHETKEVNKPNIFKIIGHINRQGIDPEKKIQLVKEAKIQPRMLIKMLVKRNDNMKILQNLVTVDKMGEPTIEAIIYALERK